MSLYVFINFIYIFYKIFIQILSHIYKIVYYIQIIHEKNIFVLLNKSNNFCIIKYNLEIPRYKVFFKSTYIF